MNAEEWLLDIKTYVNNGDLASLVYLYEQLQLAQKTQTEFQYNVQFLWKHAYLQSILKKQTHIKDWLLEIYEEMPLLDRIGLKPTINYGKYI